jgi:hypothetical protein
MREVLLRLGVDVDQDGILLFVLIFPVPQGDGMGQIVSLDGLIGNELEKYHGRTTCLYSGDSKEQWSLLWVSLRISRRFHF